jgi:hypothetical protein
MLSIYQALLSASAVLGGARGADNPFPDRQIECFGMDASEILPSWCRSKKGFKEAAEKQAKRVAFYIYWNLKPFSERKYLTAEDFEEVLPLAQSREAFGLLDRDGNGKLTPRELCQGVCEIFRWVNTPGFYGSDMSLVEKKSRQLRGLEGNYREVAATHLAL